VGCGTGRVGSAGTEEFLIVFGAHVNIYVLSGTPRTSPRAKNGTGLVSHLIWH